jgi:hypothetical protein
MDLTTAQTQLDTWYAASLTLAAGKSTQIGDRMLRMEDAEEVRNMIAFWESRVAAIKAQTSADSDEYAYNQPGVRVARWTR